LDDICRYFLPYCLQLQTNGYYVVLNRQYKPLGYPDGHFEYEKYAEHLPVRDESALSWTVDRSPGIAHLYSDLTCPSRTDGNYKYYNWDMYLPKLRLLRQLGARLPAGATKTQAGLWRIHDQHSQPIGMDVSARLDRTLVDVLNPTFCRVKVKWPR
jgi:hypothetical protein